MGCLAVSYVWPGVDWRQSVGDLVVLAAQAGIHSIAGQTEAGERRHFTVSRDLRRENISLDPISGRCRQAIVISHRRQAIIVRQWS